MAIVDFEYLLQLPTVLSECVIEREMIEFWRGKPKEHISDAANNIYDEDIASSFCPTEDFAQQCAFTLNCFKLVMLILGCNCY